MTVRLEFPRWDRAATLFLSVFGSSFFTQKSWFGLDKLFSAFGACLGLTYFSLDFWVKSAYFKKLQFGAFRRPWLAFSIELLCIYDNYNIYDDYTHHISHITHHQISFSIASHLSHLLHTTPYIKEFGAKLLSPNIACRHRRLQTGWCFLFPFIWYSKAYKLYGIFDTTNYVIQLSKYNVTWPIIYMHFNLLIFSYFDYWKFYAI